VKELKVTEYYLAPITHNGGRLRFVSSSEPRGLRSDSRVSYVSIEVKGKYRQNSVLSEIIFYCKSV